MMENMMVMMCTKCDMAKMGPKTMREKMMACDICGGTMKEMMMK